MVQFIFSLQVSPYINVESVVICHPRVYERLFSVGSLQIRGVLCSRVVQVPVLNCEYKFTNVFLK